MLGVMGPHARQLLSTLTEADLSNQAFPYATAQTINLGYAQPLLLRMSYVGELGWEIYVPTDFAGPLFDTLMIEGEKLGMALVGLHAVDSLRLEKGYRHWGSDISPDVNPYEAGLGFAVKLNKGDFIGRQALLDKRQSPPDRRLALFTLDNPALLLYHDEPVFRDGVLASRITHGAYAHLLGCSMGMGYLEKAGGVTEEWILAGKYEINVEGQMIPARVHLKAPYDPEGKRLKM
jgi:4-methylaminobutanoate oxidase (formaldehyde-forming)